MTGAKDARTNLRKLLAPWAAKNGLAEAGTSHWSPVTGHQSLVTGHGMKKVTVIGAGIVGIATACYLRRDGHEVTVVTADPVGEYCSFGNAGMLNNAGCVLQAVPGILAKVPGYLTDPLGPLTVRWSYLPKAMPWLLRFIASATRKRVARGADALSSLI